MLENNDDSPDTLLNVGKRDEKFEINSPEMSWYPTECRKAGYYDFDEIEHLGPDTLLNVGKRD